MLGVQFHDIEDFPTNMQGRRSLFHDLDWVQIKERLTEGKCAAIEMVKGKSVASQQSTLRNEAKKRIKLHISIAVRDGRLWLRIWRGEDRHPDDYNKKVDSNDS